MISTLILTLNEETNLPACLDAVRWSDDIVVLDSLSTDRTADIARSAGARVVTRPFDNELNQRTFSIREIPFKYPWVYNPDADEIATPELRDEMLRAVADSHRPEVAFRCRFRVMFKGRWIRRSSLYPTWVVRLFRPERLRFERTTNLRYIADGPEGLLKEHFVHNTFARGIQAWTEKHRRYAAAEAVESLSVIRRGKPDLAGLLAPGDPVRRRRALKELSFILPFRPQLRFVYMYLFRLGCLDGTPGFEYCRLLARYEAMIVSEIKKQRRMAVAQETEFRIRNSE
jgi:glycosyltransferase involved in cell wall biosynthesis